MSDSELSAMIRGFFARMTLVDPESGTLRKVDAFRQGAVRFPLPIGQIDLALVRRVTLGIEQEFLALQERLVWTWVYSRCQISHFYSEDDALEALLDNIAVTDYPAPDGRVAAIVFRLACRPTQRVTLLEDGYEGWQLDAAHQFISFSDPFLHPDWQVVDARPPTRFSALAPFAGLLRAYNATLHEWRLRGLATLHPSESEYRPAHPDQRR